jgi:hypothetical protein
MENFQQEAFGAETTKVTAPLEGLTSVDELEFEIAPAAVNGVVESLVATTEFPGPEISAKSFLASAVQSLAPEYPQVDRTILEESLRPLLATALRAEISKIQINGAREQIASGQTDQNAERRATVLGAVARFLENRPDRAN